MLLFGNDSIVKQYPNFVLMVDTVFNLSNSYEMGIGLDSLVPPFFPTEGKDFDLNYANYILTNENAFTQMMHIVYSLYEGKNIFVMVGNGDYREYLTDSLIKFIQQRYGYNSYIINEIDDLLAVTDSEFSIQGLYNLDQDKERYVMLTTDFEMLLKEIKDWFECCITNQIIQQI